MLAISLKEEKTTLETMVYDKFFWVCILKRLGKVPMISALRLLAYIERLLVYV